VFSSPVSTACRDQYAYRLGEAVPSSTGPRGACSGTVPGRRRSVVARICRGSTGFACRRVSMHDPFSWRPHSWRLRGVPVVFVSSSQHYCTVEGWCPRIRFTFFAWQSHAVAVACRAVQCKTCARWSDSAVSSTDKRAKTTMCG